MNLSAIWAVVALIAIFLIYRINLGAQALQSQQLANQQANLSNPWITVPGAVNQGLQGIGSIATTFSNLFSAQSYDSSGDGFDYYL